MSKTNLRKMTASTKHLEDSLCGGVQNRISVESIDSYTVEPIVDQYPFNGQKIIKGTLSYEEESTHTSGRTITIDFEFREESDLFLTKFYTDVSSPDSITTRLAEAAPSQIKVYRNLHVPEDALWDFLMGADRILEITVLDQGEEVQYDEVDGVAKEDVIGEYSIEEASVGFTEEDHNIFVRYRDGSLQIETDWERGREYIIQTFEREVIAE